MQQTSSILNDRHLKDCTSSQSRCDFTARVPTSIGHAAEQSVRRAYRQQDTAMQPVVTAKCPTLLLSTAEQKQHKQALEAAQQAYAAYEQQMLWLAKSRTLDMSTGVTK